MANLSSARCKFSTPRPRRARARVRVSVLDLVLNRPRANLHMYSTHTPALTLRTCRLRYMGRAADGGSCPRHVHGLVGSQGQKHPVRHRVRGSRTEGREFFLRLAQCVLPPPPPPVARPFAHDAGFNLSVGTALNKRTLCT